MAIDFGGALTSDNYSTGVLSKLNATDIALAQFLDPTYVTYTGTITTGSKRLTSTGVIEQYNGSAWVALSVGYVLKAGDTMTGNLSVPRIDQSNGSINFASLGNGSTSWQIGTQTAGKPLDIFIGGAVIAQFSDTGLAVTGTISSTGDYKIAGTGIYNAIATNTSLGLFADTNAYAGIKAYGSSHATKANVTELLAGAGVVVGSVSSTGLAVTGALSATGVANFLGGSSIGITIRANGLTTEEFNGTDSILVNYKGYANGTTQFRQFLIYDGKSNQIAAFATGGLAVTGALSATGTSSLARIDQSNGSINFASLGNGSTSWQIGTQTALKPLDIFIGGSVRAQFSDTGLAVTGDVSSTGDYKIAGTGIYNATATNTSLGLFADTNAYAGIKAYGSSHATKANVTELLAGAGVVVGSLSSTGLAVTGTLSATKRAYTSATAVSFSATPTFDASTTNIIVFGNLTANVTSMTMSNAQEGQFLSIRFRQDATGSRTVALPSGAKVNGAITATANLTSYLNITYNATDSRWEGNWSNIPA